jgi:hypothetical protein
MRAKTGADWCARKIWVEVMPSVIWRLIVGPDRPDCARKPLEGVLEREWFWHFGEWGDDLELDLIGCSVMVSIQETG